MHNININENNETASVFFITMPSDSYYKPYFTSFDQYLQNFIPVVHENDLLLIVANTKLKKTMYEHNFVAGNIPDIWMRDFSPIQTKAGLFKFRYRPSYLNKSDAKYIEDKYMQWFKSLGLAYKPVDLILDGGNFNYNGEHSGRTRHH